MDELLNGPDPRLWLDDDPARLLLPRLPEPLRSYAPNAFGAFFLEMMKPGRLAPETPEYRRLLVEALLGPYSSVWLDGPAKMRPIGLLSLEAAKRPPRSERELIESPF